MMVQSTLVAAVVVSTVVLGVSKPVTADEDLEALGRQLAQECTPCHRLDGVDAGIPAIVGLDPGYFVEAMSFYKIGQRNNPAMVSVAQSLDDRQIKALALYFAALPKPETLPAPAKKRNER